MLLILFPNAWRTLRRLITWLLSSGLATEVIRMQYLQSYQLLSSADKHKKIKKTDLKLLAIYTEKPEEVQAFLAKFPEARLLPHSTFPPLQFS